MDRFTRMLGVSTRLPWFLEPLVSQLCCLLEDRLELGRVVREGADDGGEFGGDADQLIRVVVEGLTSGAHRGEAAVDQAGQLLALLDEGLHGLDGLVQRVDRLGPSA